MQELIVCPRCGAVSYNPNDIRERFCGQCHAWHDEMTEPPNFCSFCGARYRGETVQHSPLCKMRLYGQNALKEL